MRRKGVPLLDVLARWGYSEIVDSNFERCYDNTVRDVASLRSKRRGVIAFEALLPHERYDLAFGCGSVRSALIGSFTRKTDLFDVIEIDRPMIGRLLVPPHVWHPESEDRFVTFEYFMTTTAEDSADSRNVKLDGQYSFPADPLAIGHFYGDPTLIDGYHRAALLWKFGPADGKLMAYVPQALLGAFGKQAVA